MDNQQNTPYADAVAAQKSLGHAHFTTPGHGYESPGLLRFFGDHALRLDIPPLIAGIDVGSESALLQAKRLAAQAWGAKRTWFLTNGASQGNRMVFLALASQIKKMLVQRNSHSSVFDGLVTSGITPAYVMPAIDSTHQIAQVVTAKAVEESLKREAASGEAAEAVLIVSPNYFGAVADVRAIADVCAQWQVPLIVDGSWGAHFGFHKDLPPAPLAQGADIALASMHKLGGSFTQTAMLHLADTGWGSEIEPLLDTAARMTESTSASAILLASLDIARSELATGANRIESTLKTVQQLKSLVAKTPGLRIADQDFLRLPGVTGIDPLHIVIDVSGLGVTGEALHHALAHGEEVTFIEISTQSVIVPIIGAGANPDPQKLVTAILRTAKQLKEDTVVTLSKIALPAASRAVCTPREAFLQKKELVPAAEAVGRISGDMLAAYPPGIPNLVPGEIVTQEIVDYLQSTVSRTNGYVRGAASPDLSVISVCVEESK